MEKAHEIYKERGLKWPWDEEEQQRQEDSEHKSDEEALAELEEKTEEAKEEGKPPPYVPPPVTTRVNVLDAFDQKRAAILVHRTQFAPEGTFLTMPERHSPIGICRRALQPCKVPHLHSRSRNRPHVRTRLEKGRSTHY